MAQVTVVQHALVQDRLTRLRNRESSVEVFRRLLRDLGVLLGYEVTRDLELAPTRVLTPLREADGSTLRLPPPCVVSVLRAGNGLVAGLLEILPEADVGHIGLERDEATLEPTEYYFSVPDGLADRTVIVADPMLATGNSALAALRKLKAAGARDLRYVCLVAAPAGIDALTAALPDVPIWTAAVDSHLDERGYIVPGLGDAGDRLYGTSPRSSGA